MKKYIFYELVKHATRKLNYEQKHRWQKKFKYIAAFAFVGVLLFGGLAIWGTVAVVSSVASSVNRVTIQESVTKSQDTLKAISSQPLITKDCLDTVGGMLSTFRLLTVPLEQNIQSVRGACFDKSGAPVNHQNQS